MAGKPIFVSHAVRDKALVDALVDVFVTSGVAPHDAFFCSSLEGMGIPRGSNFIDFVKQQLQGPRLVIMLLSPNYFESAFCLCELGAAWALSHTYYPLLVPPLDYEDMKAVLVGTQAGKITDRMALNDLRDRICQVLNTTSATTARWEVKRDPFLARLDDLIKASGKPAKIDYAKFEEAQKNYEGAVAELKKDEERIGELNALIEKLKAAKDAKQVTNILVEASGEWEAFEGLVAEAREAIQKLPGLVGTVLFHHFADTYFRPDEFSRDGWEEARRIAAQDYIEIRDHDIIVNQDDPAIRRAIDSVSAVADFLQQASEDFEKQYLEEYDHRPVIENQRFWSAHFFQ